MVVQSLGVRREQEGPVQEVSDHRCGVVVVLLSDRSLAIILLN